MITSVQIAKHASKESVGKHPNPGSFCVDYIEYDPSEYRYYTDVTNITLDFICDMYGPEVRDMLLVPVVGAIVDNRHAI